MYRSVDAGMQSVNIRTLTEAAQSLGASWRTILARVIFPNLLPAVLNGSFITFSIVLGEFTIASLLSQPAFSPYMLDLSYRQADQATALGIVSFVLTWLSVLLIQIVGRGRGGISAAGVHSGQSHQKLRKRIMRVKDKGKDQHERSRQQFRGMF
jgi:putative spermidine/putrescine transport system permease protein